MKILCKSKILINHDLQKRCYNGAYANASMGWGKWEVLESNLSPSEVDKRLAFWVELNDYAVSCRGNDAKREFKVLNE